MNKLKFPKDEELKKKIIDVLRDNIVYELRDYPDDDCVEVIFEYEPPADALIAAGMGDVKEAVKDFAKNITVLIKGTMGMGSTDFWKGYNKAKYDAIKIIEQAEKELAEERKNV